MKTVAVGEPVDDVGARRRRAPTATGSAPKPAKSSSASPTTAAAARGGAGADRDAGGEPTRHRQVEVPAGGSAPLVFTATPGATVQVSLAAGGDGLAADDSAFVSVPEPGGERITLVGERTRALPLARALASVPGVKLRLRTPQHLSRRPTRATSDLLVLDDFIPKGGLPDAPGAAPRQPAALPRRHGRAGR